MDIGNIRLPLTPANSTSIQPGAAKPAGSGAASGSTGADKTSGLNFNQMLQSLSDQQNQSDSLIQKLAAGEDVDIHQVMISNETTDISFRVAMAIRDRLVEAYRDVSHMSV